MPETPLLHLALAAGMDQPEMHHHHMHLLALNKHVHMQQPALFEAVVGHVRMVRVQHRPAREQGVAVFTVARDRVGAVDRLVALG